MPSSNVVYQPFAFNTESGFFSGKSYELTSRMEITVRDETQFISVLEVLASRKGEWAFVKYVAEDSNSEENEETALAKALAKIERRKAFFERELNISLTPLRFGEHLVTWSAGGGMGGAVATAGVPTLNAQGNPVAASVYQSMDAFGQIGYNVLLNVVYSTAAKRK